ncbi:MAG: prephenate/arogenate dehydrogenase [Gloeomargarita sp. SKYBB_i_bin120]|nr:prephenate/arogenate dehydrogenase [Gloeomargarita sp. SKYG98]MCS7292198.1 prephenate/arogenate dehydrogenase [Gloeomargarita sp. SKYB120]MDW8177759.1 prephenate/arogenate dehydrogenase [Gloeomargarita sp. SKYBB_i_bin120]
MHIGIVGLGLIGGSLALDWQRAGHTVTGVSRQAKTVALALERGAIDRGGTDLSLVSTCRVVVLCVPLHQMVPVAQALCPYLRTDAILTDVGSVKAPLVRTLTPLWPGFIGGHPMAGTEQQGIEAAQPGLFRQRPYVLTPTPQTNAQQLARLEQLVTELDAQVLICDAETHDRAVAWISHLPIWVSAALIAACAQESDPQVARLAQQLAGPGWRDTTRVGGGNPELGVCLAQFNREYLLQGLRRYLAELSQIIQMVEKQDLPALTTYLQDTQQLRQGMTLPP